MSQTCRAPTHLSAQRRVDEEVLLFYSDSRLQTARHLVDTLHAAAYPRGQSEDNDAGSVATAPMMPKYANSWAGP